MTTGPLAGVRVIDMTTAWAGPYASRILAYLGAEVIHVEAATRLDIWRGGVTGAVGARRFPGNDPGERPYNRCVQFNSQNINKLGLSLDIKDDEGSRLLRELVLASDALISNFAPGMIDRLGLDYEALRAENPGLIVVEMPGFGLDGPMSQGRALGPTMEMEAGMASLVGYGDGVPISTGPAYLDPIGGYFGAAATMTALIARQRNGVGQHVELPQTEAAMQTVGEILLSNIVDGDDFEPRGNAVPGAAPHDAYPAEGHEEWVALSVRDDGQWRTLAELIGRPELADDPRYRDAESRSAHQDELHESISDWTRKRGKHAAVRALIERGVTAAPVNHGADLAASDYLHGRGMFTELDHPQVGRYPYLGLPFRLSRTPGGQFAASPALGEHTREILTRILGVADAQLDELDARGVTSDRPPL